MTKIEADWLKVYWVPCYRTVWDPIWDNIALFGQLDFFIYPNCKVRLIFSFFHKRLRNSIIGELCWVCLGREEAKRFFRQLLKLTKKKLIFVIFIELYGRKSWYNFFLGRLISAPWGLNFPITAKSVYKSNHYS